MSKLNITKHMTTDEIIKVMENTWELTETEQVLLERLKARSEVNVSNEKVKGAISRLDDIISETRSIDDYVSDIRIDAKHAIETLENIIKENEVIA